MERQRQVTMWAALRGRIRLRTREASIRLSGVRPALILIFLASAPLLVASSPARAAGSVNGAGMDVRKPAFLLGRWHAWLVIDQVDFGGDVHDDWGVNKDQYVGLSGWWGGRANLYFGVEIGRIEVGTAIDGQGDRIEDFSLTSFEVSFKKLFELSRAGSIGIGLGSGGFWARGEEVDAFGRSDLADLGFGVQGFADLNWRFDHLVIGLEIKYQSAFDLIDVDYSNIRLGGHIGVVF